MGGNGFISQDYHETTTYVQFQFLFLVLSAVYDVRFRAQKIEIEAHA